jgi:hypothetical protein
MVMGICHSSGLGLKIVPPPELTPSLGPDRMPGIFNQITFRGDRAWRPTGPPGGDVAFCQQTSL